MSNQSDQYGTLDELERPAPQGAFPVWSKVFTKPVPQTFLEVTAHPDATARNAYIWIFIAGTFSGLVYSALQFAVGMTALRQTAPGLQQFPGLSAGVGFGGILGVICSAPVTGIFSVVGFAISTALIHWIARFLGGQANFDKMAYALGAVTAPMTIISAFLVPINAIPYASFCTLPVIIILSIFAVYLEVAAVKAVQGFGWLEAGIAVFLPVILLAFLCAFAVIGILRTLGPSINDIFQQIQPAL